MSYVSFKASVLGKHIGDKECVSLVVNNPKAYVEYLFPGVSWLTVIKPVSGAKDLLGAMNSKYFKVTKNDHSNVSQLPKQGDVMVFGATPAKGYTNTFNNPWGHTGICEKANSTGYWLLQQNAPTSGEAVNVTYYPWRFRPCLGWATPIHQPVITTKTLTTTESIPFDKKTINDPTLPKGQTKVIPGQDGIEIVTTTITYTDGKETNRTVKKTVGTKPVIQVTVIGTKEQDESNPKPPQEPPKETTPPVENGTPTVPKQPDEPTKTEPTSPTKPKDTAAQKTPLNFWQLLIAIIKRLLGVKE